MLYRNRMKRKNSIDTTDILTDKVLVDAEE